MGRVAGGSGAVDVGKLSAGDIESVADRLGQFLEPYQALMGWKPRRGHVKTFIDGLLSGLERKSVEPIAVTAGQGRKPLQHFVGVSQWDERPLLEHLRRDVAREIGDAHGVFIIDGSANPKKGTESVGVARQWCGRLGKVESCQIGVYLAYAGQGSRTLVDRRLYLPQAWTEDPARCAKVHVPEKVRFKKAWELADEMLRQHREVLPHRWITGDDEFGRPTQFRDRLAKRAERYVLEVPSQIMVRKRRGLFGRPAKWQRVTDFIRRLPVSAWQRFTVRDGEKGPIEVCAVSRRVETRRRGGKPRPETLLVMEALVGSDRWIFLSNASRAPIEELVEVASKRHLIEEAFGVGKGEVGLDHYEVRTWQGWHHHTACALIAQWFLVREKRRLGGKSTADDRPSGPVHR